MLLIAGGVGIAPIRVRDRRPAAHVPVDILFRARRADGSSCATSSRRSPARGRASGCATSSAAAASTRSTPARCCTSCPDVRSRDIYTCGPDALVESVRHAAEVLDDAVRPGARRLLLVPLARLLLVHHEEGGRAMKRAILVGGGTLAGVAAVLALNPDAAGIATASPPARRSPRASGSGRARPRPPRPRRLRLVRHHGGRRHLHRRRRGRRSRLRRRPGRDHASRAAASST